MRTPDSVERDIRKALEASSTVLRASELNGDTLAWVEYEGRGVEVAVDPFRGGLIECVVHELLHAVYARQLAVWGELEEAVVLALEQQVMALINSSPRRVRWWRERIAKKLGGPRGKEAYRGD